MHRFWDKVNKTEDCWTWTASTTSGGYGRFSTSHSTYTLAHRWAYEDAYGPIPPGLELDHLCRVRNCVRPDHLEAVTHTENVRRGNGGRRRGPGAPKSGRPRNPDGSFTHCPQGHEMSGTNLYVGPSGFRNCRACAADRKGQGRSARPSALGCQT